MKMNPTLPCANNECEKYNEAATTCCCRACTNKMSSNAARIINLQRGESKLAEFLANVPQPKCKNPDCDELCYKIPRYWKWSTYCSIECKRKCHHPSHEIKSDDEKIAINEKRKATSIKNYGVEHPLQSIEIKQKIKDKLINKYGVEHAGQIESGKLKRIQTCLEKYGETSPGKNKEVKEKQKQTMLARYGVEHALQHKQFHDKMKQTNIERYGSEHSAGLPQFIEKRIRTIKERYGVHSTAVLQDVIDKRHATSTLKYGGPNKAYLNFTEDGIELMKEENFHLLLELNKTMSMTEIAMTHGMSLGSIQQRFTKHNVEPKVHYTSIFHKQILQYINTLPDIQTIESNRRDIIAPYEIDICINNDILIECNGLFWHSEYNLNDTNYHLNKAIKCEAINKPLIFIWQCDWNYKQNICKSMISSLLNNNLIINSDSCDLGELSIEEYNNFFDENHIEGKITFQSNESVCYGLNYNNEAVCAILFSIDEDSNWNIERFSTKLFTNVTNGFQAILNHFIMLYDPLIIISSFPRQWHDNNFHKSLGFELCTTSEPTYLFTKDYKELLSIEQKNAIDPNNERYNWDRAWNCGNNVYVWRIT